MRRNINKMLSSYHFFSTQSAALDYVRAHKWRKYVLSSNATGDCWTLYHKER